MPSIDYDAVIIGSGIGGLTAALSLSQAGQKVIVLEQHSLPGGWSHSFSFAHHIFCPGIHYIGELGPNERVRRALEDLGLANDLTFTELNPNAYDRTVSGEESFDFPKGKEALALRLEKLFPRESRGIGRYLSTCERIGREWEEMSYFTNGLKDLCSLPFRAPTISRYALCTFRQFLGNFVSDPRLHWILSTQCLDSGSSPARVSGVAQAIVNWHYMNGGYYPQGGMKKVISAYLKAIRKHGGTIMTRTRVERILIQKIGARRATGVLLADGTEISARNIISNADVGVTFQRLIDKQWLSRSLSWRLRRTTYSSSCGSVYMVFDTAPRNLGLDSGNVFYSQFLDLERTYNLALSPNILSANHFPLLFLSADSAKDPRRSRKTGEYTASAFAPMCYDTFKPFEGGSPGKRPDGYATLKSRLSEMMLNSVAQIVPNIKKHLVAYDVGTPITNSYYVLGEKGSMYGTEKILEFIGPFAHKIKTEIDNLYLCGHSTAGHGFVGGLISGRTAAAKALGCLITDLPRAKDQHLKIVPAEPAELSGP